MRLYTTLAFGSLLFAVSASAAPAPIPTSDAIHIYPGCAQACLVKEDNDPTCNSDDNTKALTCACNSEWFLKRKLGCFKKECFGQDVSDAWDTMALDCNDVGVDIGAINRFNNPQATSTSTSTSNNPSTTATTTKSSATSTSDTNADNNNTDADTNTAEGGSGKKSMPLGTAIGIAVTVVAIVVIVGLILYIRKIKKGSANPTPKSGSTTPPAPPTPVAYDAPSGPGELPAYSIGPAKGYYPPPSPHNLAAKQEYYGPQTKNAEYPPQQQYNQNQPPVFQELPAQDVYVTPQAQPQPHTQGFVAELPAR